MNITLKKLKSAARFKLCEASDLENRKNVNYPFKLLLHVSIFMERILPLYK
jgi:hypothetical protein